MLSGDEGLGVIGVLDTTTLYVSSPCSSLLLLIYCKLAAVLDLFRRQWDRSPLKLSTSLRPKGDAAGGLLSTKQGFQDTQVYADLEKAIATEVQEFWDQCIKRNIHQDRDRDRDNRDRDRHKYQDRDRHRGRGR